MYINGDTEDIKDILSLHPDLTVVLATDKIGSALCGKECKIFNTSIKIKTVDITVDGDAGSVRLWDSLSFFVNLKSDSKMII